MKAEKILLLTKEGRKIVWQVSDKDFHKLKTMEIDLTAKAEKYRADYNALKSYYRKRITDRIKIIDIEIEKLTK